MQTDEAPLKFECYRLIVTIAGPNYRDEIVFEDQDVMALEPEYVDRNGLTFERYLGDQQADGDLVGGAREWIELRFDYVVARKLEIVYETPKPEPVLAEPDAEIDQPAEVRIRPRPEEP